MPRPRKEPDLVPTYERRRAVLEERGIVLEKKTRRKHRVRKKQPPVSRVSPKLKTTHMKYIELAHGESIEDILLSDSCRRVSAKYGMSKGTVVAWRRKLNLNYTVDNLPSCIGCKLEDLVCQKSGFCHVLIKMKADEDVIYEKKRELDGKADKV